MLHGRMYGGFADMTTEDDTSGASLERMNANLQKIEELSQRMVASFARKKGYDAALDAPGQDLFMKAAAAYMYEMMHNPSKILQHQVGYWGKSLKHYVEAQQALAKGQLTPPDDQTPKDRRFSNPLWETHPYFNYIKQQYLMSAEAMERAVADLGHLDPQDQKRVEYFSRQIVDMFSPTNFLGTNPEALSRAVETDGQSLVDGLENLVRDLEANDGDLLVTLAKKDAFRIGDNLATTPGSVVFRNRMFELIQYTPSTEKAHRTPLIIFPPWINKFYIMDLKPANSLIKWVVEQGYTLFVVSWVNPDTSYADVGLDTYVQEGFLTAIDQVKQITGEPKVNVAGYCIAGTTLALTLALMAKRGDTSVRSATFFTTLTDFSDQGEVGVFLSNDFVDGIEREVKQKGVLHSFFMTRTFSYLRANDLVYAPAIRSYMMGEAPPAFDLLFWNGDSTNLPARMSIEYLRNLCQNDLFAKGTLEICGEVLSIHDIKTPVFAVACETDHIAAWKSAFNGLRQFASKDKTFVLSESGHIAGIINPPSKRKYGHYTNDAALNDADNWQATATHHDGSWWPRWSEWLGHRSGAMVAALQPGAQESHPALCPAPGSYVVTVPKD